MKIADSNLILNVLEARNHVPASIKPILAPPLCQVEEQKKKPSLIIKGKGTISFEVPAERKRQKKRSEKYDRRKLRRRAVASTKEMQRYEDMHTKTAAILDDLIADIMTMEEGTVEHVQNISDTYAEEAHDVPGAEDEAHDVPFEELVSYNIPTPKGSTTSKIRAGVEDGSIPSAVVDTGTTSTVGRPQDAGAFIHTGKKSDKEFAVANGEIEKATIQMMLAHEVRDPARTVDIVPGISTASLISTSKFADANYITIFDEEEVNIYDANNTEITVSRGAILKGWRMKDTGLWRVPLVKNVKNLNTDTVIINKTPSELLSNRPPPKEAINNVYELKSKAEMVRYYHAAAGFLTKPTWIDAIENNFYASWPGLTADAVRKHYPESEETPKGHMKKQKSGIRSTKKQLIDPREGEEGSSIRPRQKQRDVMIKVFDTNDELAMKIYTDQTGRFPTRSSRGNQYIMVLAEVDSDAILVEAMRNRTAGEMVKTYNKLIHRLKACGIQPKHHILDNECSEEFKKAIKSHNMTYQLVPPHDHRRNLAERAIQTFKAHFISILCGVDENFPMHLWCRLLPQTEMTLNMSRKSKMVPNISAHAYLHGQHDYNAQPLAPLGCAVEMHVQPDVRETWAPHSVSGYNVGTSFEHYRCYIIWVKDTKSVRIGNTIFFKHKYLTMPTLTTADALLKAAHDMATALLGGINTTNETAEALEKLMDIYKTNAKAEKLLEEEARPQRVRMKNAKQQRVDREAKQAGELLSSNIISQDVESTDEPPQNNAPASNTRSKSRSLTQEVMLMTMEMSSKATTFTPRQAASRQFPSEFIMEYAGAVLDGATGNLLEYRHLIKDPRYKEIWGVSFGDEIGRLAQGLKGRVEGTNTIFFIHKHQVPYDRRKDVTYDRICCNVRPEKADPNRTRLTAGGNLINHPGDCGTPTADLLTVKMLLNSIVSTPGAKFMGIDIKNFYLNTPMARYEYLKMKIEHFPEDVIEEYNLREKVTPDGYLYVEVRKGMYGLPQAGILAQELLEKRLKAKGYRQSKLTPGFWKHEWRPISFTLVVDDFGVKYVGEEHAQHLLSAIKEHYECSSDWEGSRYLGLTLDWDYEKREVHLSMPGYVHEAIKRFQHEMPRRPQHQPYPHVVPNYGAKVQYSAEADTSRALDKKEKKFVQQVIGTFLYYGRAVDGTMLTALSTIASAQANPTMDTMTKTKAFLDYAATNPDAILTYRASDMVLGIHSDASYLSEPGARSRAGGHFFMSNNEEVPSSSNGAVLNVAKIIKAVMSSAAEAELGALYINAREAVPMRCTLWEMGHPQPPTPIQTDNTTALGVIMRNIQPRRTKAMDMRFHWLRCRERQSQFRWYWRRGTTNKGDYWTKHFCAAHHKAMRPEILTPVRILRALRARQGKSAPVFSTSERVC